MTAHPALITKAYTTLLHVTFVSTPDAIQIDTLISRLMELSQVLTMLWPIERSSDTTIAARLDSGETDTDSLIRQHTFDVVGIRFGSPLEIALAIANAPKRVTNAVIAFFKGIVFHEETRQRLAAEGAKAWEDAVAARLRNIEATVRIAKGIQKDRKIDRNTIDILHALHTSLQHGPLRITDVRVEENE